MSTIRSEVQSFAHAAQVLIASTMLEPLTDDEERACADYFARLEQLLPPHRTT